MAKRAKLYVLCILPQLKTNLLKKNLLVEWHVKLVASLLWALRSIFSFFWGVGHCARSLLLWVGFLQLQWAGATLWLWCESFSWQLLLLLQTGSGCLGSVVVAHELSCSATYGILVPRSGMEPMSPTLAGGFLTTGPPGKPKGHILKQLKFQKKF